MRPRRHKTRIRHPKRAPNRPKTPPGGLQDAARCPPKRTKEAPRRPRTSSGRPPGSHFGYTNRGEIIMPKKRPQYKMACFSNENGRSQGSPDAAPTPPSPPRTPNKRGGTDTVGKSDKTRNNGGARVPEVVTATNNGEAPEHLPTTPPGATNNEAALTL